MPPIHQSFNSFEKRLKSFSKINLQPRFARLASAGFWYNSLHNYMECHFCTARAYNFFTCNNPEVFHAKRSPECMFLRKKLGDLWIHNAINNYYPDYDEEVFLCKLCYTRKIFCVFMPCGHAVCCNAGFFPLKNCPYCKRHIRSFQRLYY